MGAALERITAAATRLITRKGSSGASTGNARQQLAWDLWEDTPEVQQFAGWVSNAMSGARLIAGRRGPDGTIQEVSSTSRAAELVRSIAGGMDGQAELLGGAGTHLAVGGETWAVIIPDPEADSFADDKWVMLSSEEVKPQRGKLKVTIDGEELEIREPTVGDDLTGNDPVAIRIWDPSPRKHWQATSPVMGSITVLEELRLLNAAVAAIARSRITGRGVLLVPTGTRFPVGKGQDQAEDSLLDVFIEVASTAIREPESAAATVPIVLEVPGDALREIKWIQFSSEFDALAIQLREEAIRRFASGADVPAELLLGLGDVSHWGAWAITAEALKMGAEPRLGLFCNALTQQWLRPLLEAEGDADAADVMVWYDTSALRSSSNKGASALEAFKLGLISGAAARRELGFTEADGPTDEELRDAQSVDDLLAPADDEEDILPVNETQSTPATEDQLSIAASVTGVSDLPSLKAAMTDGRIYPALTAAVDGLVFAAMVTAGRKIMRTPACPRPHRGSASTLAASGRVHTAHPVHSYADVDAYKLLDGAWVRVPELAARYGVDAGVLTAALDGYARDMLVTGQPHTYENTVRMLAQSGLIPSTLIGMVKP